MRFHCIIYIIYTLASKFIKFARKIFFKLLIILIWCILYINDIYFCHLIMKIKIGQIFFK